MPGGIGFGIDSGQLTYAMVKANADATLSPTGFDRTYSALIADVSGIALEGLPDGITIEATKLHFARNSSTVPQNSTTGSDPLYRRP